MPKLSQVLAIERGVKERTNKEIDALYKAVQKPELFDGFTKVYQKKNDQADDQPPQVKKVQFRVQDVWGSLKEQFSDLWAVTAQKDYANTAARADLEVDGAVILKDVPTTFLLFLEKQLTDIRTVLTKTPVLDPAEEWKVDPGKGLFVTEPTTTLRTAKIQEPIVLYPHSDKHPAQTQLITTDKVVGEWEQIKVSGAVPPDTVRQRLAKVDKLLRAVKFAREKANQADAPEQEAAGKLAEFILS